MATTERKNIVIIGGGIIGSTSAYFLSHHPSFNRALHNITLIEATKIAGGASGKAGGLLALWAYPECIVPLSYRLHKELAQQYGGAERWGYRAVHCGQLDAKGRHLSRNQDKDKEEKVSVSLQKRSQEALGLLRAAGVPKDLDWVAAEGVKGYEEMGDPSTTAQVHPYLFTTSMAELAQEAGVEVVLGSVTSVDCGNASGSSAKVNSVTYKSKEDGSSHTIEADTVIVAAGPWTSEVYPPAPISAMRAHSVTIRPSRPVSAFALFTHISIPTNTGITGLRHKTATPEIYARPNNEVYACGEGDTLIPLPTSTDLVQVDDDRCQEIVDQVGSISDELRDGEVTARQACYLPSVSTGGGPMIGWIPSVQGLAIATGHTCWGIQNGPATGKCVSELVWDGKVKSAKIASLDPKRYM